LSNMMATWSCLLFQLFFLLRAILQRQHSSQGCQMVCFLTKNTNLGKFWRVLQWKMLVYFMADWSILRPFGIFCGHLIYFMYGYSV
jgi:hypothetical protein